MLNAAVGASGTAAREAAYLAERLAGPRHERRRLTILDTGCGTGARAVALALAGFDVVAFDPPPGAIVHAEPDGDDAWDPGNGRVRWIAADALAPDRWPRVGATAAICSAWWSAGGHPQRTLRRLRQHLGPGSLLIVSVAIDREGEQDAIADTVRRAGFAIERRDEDFGGTATAGDRRTLQIVARAMATPPESLAIHEWGSDSGSAVELDLRYEPDEADFLDPRPADIWLDVSAAGAGAHSAAHYPVDDPYGTRRAAHVVSRFFRCDLQPAQITFAAGVTSLLHDLCGLADGGSIAADPLAHGDLEAWAIARGIPTSTIATVAPSGELARALLEHRPAMLHLDRPDFTGGVADLDTILAVARAAARGDTVVLIDESALPYLGPSASAATLVNRVPNLVVLRGFTKAYSWGGLRAGFAVASKEIARHVRELVAPMQVAQNSLAAALRMLAAGDIFERIRERVRLLKPPAFGALDRAGFEPIRSHPHLPWIAMPDPDRQASKRMAALGLRPLEPSRPPSLAGPDLIRITVPLTDARHDRLLSLLASSSGGFHG